MTVSDYFGDPAQDYLTPFSGPQPENIAGPNTRAVVTIEEAIGATQDTVTVANYVHLLAVDAHSEQSLYGYTEGALSETFTQTGDNNPEPVQRSYERWFRIRFDPPFNSVWAMRFYVPTFQETPGWTISFGTSSTYQTPVSTPSAIAVLSLPTTDPGPLLPNCGGYVRLPGTGTQYSDWIVMQASVDPSVATSGPIFGFTIEGTLIPIQYVVNWIED